MKHIAKDLVARITKSPWLDLLPGYGISITAHLVALLVLAMIIVELTPKTREMIPVEAVGNDGSDRTSEPLDTDPLSIEDGAKHPAAAEQSTVPLVPLAETGALPPVELKVHPIDFKDDFGAITAPTGRLSGELAGRSGPARTALVSKGGGSAASERCVTSTLRWLARHQQTDGKWSFRHGTDDPGSLDRCTTGATGLALLAFLGAGHTHRSENARHRVTVEKGIRFLLSQMKGEGKTTEGDLRGTVVGNEGMYAHAIATLALCEAYAQTHDSKLKEPAQRAINFIVAAQDPKGGGWRYSPRESGDTTVTGWQLMALKSAKNSQLKVPRQTLLMAGRFLDSVATADGSRYGYDGPKENPPMTAIALLCRMYLGWTKEKWALQNGVEYLSRTGPSLDDIYYDYYATQVLHHWGSVEWKKWNDVLRDQLVQTQVKKGEGAGSWKPTGDRGAGPGGRLYQTCLSVMTLEVYYRYLPLYQKENARR